MSQDGHKIKKIEVCPWCGAQLERGSYVSPRYGGYFLPEGERWPRAGTRKAMAKRRAVVPKPGFSMLFPCTEAKALLCRACQKIIIPYESGGEREGT